MELNPRVQQGEPRANGVRREVAVAQLLRANRLVDSRPECADRRGAGCDREDLNDKRRDAGRGSDDRDDDAGGTKNDACLGVEAVGTVAPAAVLSLESVFDDRERGNLTFIDMRPRLHACTLPSTLEPIRAASHLARQKGG